MHQIEKTTFTGRDMDEYRCRNWNVDGSDALWKILSDARSDRGVAGE